MIIARSTFAGSGKFASRWLGDNFSTHKSMGYSVTGVMMQNIIGIPLAGADICGFIGNTTKGNSSTNREGANFNKNSSVVSKMSGVEHAGGR